MKPQKRAFKAFEKYLSTKLDNEKLNRVLDYANSRYEELVKENINDSDIIKTHTETKIFPSIAIFEGLKKEGYSTEESSNFVDESMQIFAKPASTFLRTILKIPGLYKKIPSIFESATKKKYGEDSGFKYKFYDTPKTQVKFDMLQCPYYEITKKYNCPEICKAFCHTDDLAYGNMHKYLKWNRTQTIGQGGKVCDFNITIKKD